MYALHATALTLSAFGPTPCFTPDVLYGWFLEELIHLIPKTFSRLPRHVCDFAVRRAGVREDDVRRAACGRDRGEAEPHREAPRQPARSQNTTAVRGHPAGMNRMR